MLAPLLERSIFTHLNQSNLARFIDQYDWVALIKCEAFFGHSHTTRTPCSNVTVFGGRKRVFDLSFWRN